MPFAAASSSRLSPLIVGLLVWFTTAFIVGATGVLSQAPFPPPAAAFLLTAGVLVLLWRSPALRGQVRGLGLRPLVAFHAVRIAAGAYFLWMAQQGTMPLSFAMLAGWGDIAVGALALVVVATCLPIQSASHRYGLLAWNMFGLADILLVLGNGVRLFTSDPALAQPFTTLPLALLPTFIVPLVIVSHLLLFVWLRRPADSA